MAKDVIEQPVRHEVTRDLWTDDFNVNIGPQHPSTHGVLRLVVTLDGEVVKKVQPYCGYLHRSIEKISENRTLLQLVCFSDRVDYVAAMNANLAVCLAGEKIAGIEVPERGQYIRVIMAELNRIASHLLWFGDFGLNLGAGTPFFYAFREREQVINLFEEVCGNRLTYNYIRPGGVAFDLPEKWVERCQSFLDYFLTKLPEYHRLVTNNPIFQVRTRGIGVVTREEALNWGLSGPSLRGSGVDFDVRRDDPYEVYANLKFRVPLGTRGDTFERYLCRMMEMESSVDIIRQCLEKLPGAQGGHAKKVSMLARIPANREVLVRTEAPRGEMSVYMCSGTGGPKPWRVKYRTASFANLAALDQLSRGYKIADLMAIFGSLDVVIPEIDR
ncbi:NADH-quinone oxidoreductase subunit D [Candidatus Woesearchaeota archaeon]|nr:NADH-quinone oxidoreductase subunit D [Candidatus Woesearchaeota archaeon]